MACRSARIAAAFHRPVRGCPDVDGWPADARTRDALHGYPEFGTTVAAHFREFFAAVRPFFDNIDEMKHDQIHHSSERR